MKKILFLVFCSLLGTSCSRPSTVSKAATDSQKPRVVNLAIWSNYITPEMIDEFEKKTGIKVEVSNYSSNEELLAKMQAGAAGYDVAIPSDYMVFAMSKLNLLHDLDLSKIANSKTLDERVTQKYYDPTNKVSLPLGWGTTGIAINQRLYKGNIKGWKDLLENKSLSGKFTLLDDVRETLGAALKTEAKSLNTRSDTDLARAKAILMEAKGRVKGFTSEPQAGLVNGEMAIAHAYSCDALQAQKKNPSIAYIIPEEGFTLWIDNMVIPASAPHVEEAHALINFLLDPKVGAVRAETLFTAPANKASLALLPKDVRDNQLLFPDAKILAKAEMIQDLGEDLPRWDRIWTEIKAEQ